MSQQGKKTQAQVAALYLSDDSAAAEHLYAAGGTRTPKDYQLLLFPMSCGIPELAA